MLWNSPELWGCSVVASKMSCNHFEDILFSLHFVSNAENHDNDDKLWKLRPIVQHVQRVCRELSADEAIVGFKGRIGFKTYNPPSLEKYQKAKETVSLRKQLLKNRGDQLSWYDTSGNVLCYWFDRKPGLVCSNIHSTSEKVQMQRRLHGGSRVSVPAPECNQYMGGVDLHK
eukprot:TRINITY_DN34101_c0_g1_i1.p1 TRINITY_DN34101_c0_g1~~TRINITY_DN34101_c0_g1_i1.p1  ORF type:complete len:172 (+),score=32.87 TRINITY_DN34101_c0_g1_i1:48-563(+)